MISNVAIGIYARMVVRILISCFSVFVAVTDILNTHFVQYYQRDKIEYTCIFSFFFFLFWYFVFFMTFERSGKKGKVG